MFIFGGWINIIITIIIIIIIIKMTIYEGYDGSYRNDFHEFNFLTNSWSAVQTTGEVPRARYRGTCVVSGDTMILHGGHGK